MTQIKRILDVISNFKDITEKEIAELVDNPSDINFSARLLDMLNGGLVTRKKIDRDGRLIWAYTATGKILRSRGDKTDQVTMAKLTKSQKTTVDDIQTQLQIELKELREWKRRALIACPKLNVDPLDRKSVV